MPKNRFAVILMVTMLLVVAAHNAQAQKPPPWYTDSLLVDTAIVWTICQANHFEVDVIDCHGDPDPGVTVTLTCPDGSQETRVTNAEGRCCFVRGFFPTGEPSWEPGYYGLTAGGVGELVYRAGNGNIHVDLSSCPPGR